MQRTGGTLVTCPSYAGKPFLRTSATAYASHAAKPLPPHSWIRGGLPALVCAPSPTPPAFLSRGDGFIGVQQLMRATKGSSSEGSTTTAPPTSLLGWEPPLWMGICSLLPVTIWGTAWVCTVGALHGAWASLWACTYLAATAWADIAPGSPPGTVDFTDMALRSIYGGHQFDPLAILHAPPHHQYSTSGQPWALDARIVRTLLPLAHQGWVAGRSVATGPGALPAVAVAQVSLMAASAVFLAVQTPVGALLAALGRASKRLAASCSALASRFSKETHKGMGAAIVQECSMEGGSSKTEGQDSRETGLDSSKTGLDSSESEGLGSSSSSSSSSIGGGGSGGSNAGSGVVAAGSVVGSKMAAAPIGGGMLNALESTAAVEAQDGAVHLDAQPQVPATLLRTAACLGLVALSTYIAASETSVPLMTGEWATQPVTFLFVAAIVVGDLALPAAVAAAAVATALVGIWQSFWSSRGSSSRETSGLISDNVDDITTHRSSGDGSKGPGSSSSSSNHSSSSSSNHSSSSSSNHSSMGTGSNGRNVGVDRESEQSSSSPSRPGSMRSMGRAGSSIPPPPLQNDASQPGQPSAVCTLRRPAWLSQLLLAIYAIRAVLDVALTVAVAMGWLSGHVSAVRIVALLLLLRICWSERPAPSPKL